MYICQHFNFLIIGEQLYYLLALSLECKVIYWAKDHPFLEEREKHGPGSELFKDCIHFIFLSTLFSELFESQTVQRYNIIVITMHDARKEIGIALYLFTYNTFMPKWYYYWSYFGLCYEPSNTCNFTDRKKPVGIFYILCEQSARIVFSLYLSKI